MSDEQTWQLFRDALARLAASGRTARFWLRDDDAVEPTEPLDKLLALTRSHEVPLSLAVIPAATGDALVERLGGESHVSVTVHGWSHRNQAPPERKKQELGPDRPAETVLGELKAGFEKLHSLYPQSFVPVLVPPWNRIDAALLPSLPSLGFKALSVYGRAKDGSAIGLVNTHVDIMDWHGTGGCLPHEDLVALLVAELDDRMAGNDEPIGVLTHHLVHDASAWHFLARLFDKSRSASISWHPLGELIA